MQVTFKMEAGFGCQEGNKIIVRMTSANACNYDHPGL